MRIIIIYNHLIKKQMIEQISPSKGIQIKLSLFIMLVTITLLSELFYRKPLFNIPHLLSYQTYVKEHPKLQMFFSIVSIFNKKAFIIPVTSFVAILHPLNKLTALILPLFITLYLYNLLKLIYSQPRPFWVNDALFNNKCSTNYGNPSGHSLTTTSTYLSLWYILTDYAYFKKPLGKLIRISLLLLLQVLCITLMLCEIFNGIHAFNQTIFGYILGICVFILFYYVLQIQYYENTSFFEKYKKHYIIILSGFICCIGILIGCFYLCGDKVDEQYVNVIKNKCNDEYVNKKYKLFRNDGLYSGSSVFGLFGIYCGYLWLTVVVEKKYKGKEEKVVNWTGKGICNWIIRVVVLGIFCSVFCLKFVIKSKEMEIMFLIKCAGLYFITGLLGFGPGVFLGFALTEMRKFPKDSNEDEKEGIYKTLNEERLI